MNCFRNVFPDVNPSDLANANTENVSGWDSTKTWTILMVVEEEFGVTIGLDLIPTLVSFAAFERQVEKKHRDS